MATKYALATGNWSATSTWSDTDGGAPGATVPADGDSVVVCAAVTLTVDVNLSGWTTGLAGLTIRGGSTPGMLAFKSDADGTYYLKIKVGANLDGTLSTNRGRLFMAAGTWAAPVDAPFGRQMVIEFLGPGAGKILATNLDIIARATAPTYPYIEVCGDLLTFTADPATDQITVPGSSYTNGAYLKVRSSGTLPAPLRDDIMYYIRGITGQPTGLAVGMGALAVDITDAGTGTHQALGHLRPNVTSVKTITDVTTDPYWTTAAPHNLIAIVGAGGNTIHCATLTNITATDLGYTPGKNANLNVPYMCLMTRNVAIRTNVDVFASPLIQFNVGDTHGAYLGCELRNTNATAALRLAGHGIDYGANITFGPAGLMANFYMPFYDCKSLNCQGIQVLCSFNFRNCDAASTFGGTIIGSNTVQLAEGSPIDSALWGSTINATCIGCNYLGAAPNVTFTGRFSYGTSVFQQSNATLLGTVDNTSAICPNRQRSIAVGATLLNVNIVFTATMNCQLLPQATLKQVGFVVSNSGGYLPGHILLSGLVEQAGWLGYMDTHLELADLWLKDCNDAQRITLPSTGLLYSSVIRLRGRRVRLQNVTGLVRDYKYGSFPLPPTADYGRYIFDPLAADGTANYGYLLCWTLGGVIATETFNSGTHGSPPVPLPFVHVATFEDSRGWVHVEIPFTGLAGQTIHVIIRHAVTTTGDWVTAPTVTVEDALLPMHASGRILATAPLTVADTNWHTTTLTYTPTFTRPLVLRMQGQGGNAAGTGTGKLYWHHTDPADVAAPPMYSF